MLSMLTEQLQIHLGQVGVITNLLVRTEQSLYSDEESHEVEIYVAEEEGAWDKPLATIHLYPLAEEEAVEIEAEIQYPVVDGSPDRSLLFERVTLVGVEAAITEKHRFLGPQQMVESVLVLDFHFVVASPRSAEEETEVEGQLMRLARQIGTLLRL
ncbi:hypothetical protein LOK74_03830 [Brevibacillus humidisoli]|uniref:hypothetical protein n=1 Tax=Brevibacillus humidisoli TaxID=2895522 RepID=UPI001E4DFA71|nr:hypothetical protein [Brevibacillus humidisoli]UFJ41654.1 hypothetical protein LOK74_03830 [Brevibacillus humidisoli]